MVGVLGVLPRGWTPTSWYYVRRAVPSRISFLLYVLCWCCLLRPVCVVLLLVVMTSTCCFVVVYQNQYVLCCMLGPVRVMLCCVVLFVEPVRVHLPGSHRVE